MTTHVRGTAVRNRRAKRVPGQRRHGTDLHGTELHGTEPHGRDVHGRDVHGREDTLRDVVVVPAWMAVASLVAGRHVHGCYPVLDADGTVVGILDLAAVAAHPERLGEPAGNLCVPCSATHPLLRTLVLENGRLVGIRPGTPLPSAS